jgi:hypothetical protein
MQFHQAFAILAFVASLGSAAPAPVSLSIASARGVAPAGGVDYVVVPVARNGVTHVSRSDFVGAKGESVKREESGDSIDGAESPAVDAAEPGDDAIAYNPAYFYNAVYTYNAVYNYNSL